MAEIEINVLTNQCLKRCIPDRATMIQEVAAWEQERSANCRTTNWQFKTKDARLKLKSLFYQYNNFVILLTQPYGGRKQNI